MYDNLKSEEILALTNFVVQRVKELDPEPRFFGRQQWHERIKLFECRFKDTLDYETNSFYGAIWHFFEGNNKLFLGTNGMRELAEHTKKCGNSWIYQKPGEEPLVIYSE